MLCYGISCHSLTIILWFQSFWIFSLCLSQPWDIGNMKPCTNSHTSTLSKPRYFIRFITQTVMFFLELLQVLEKLLQLNWPSLEFLTSIPHQRSVKQVCYNRSVQARFQQYESLEKDYGKLNFAFSNSYQSGYKMLLHYVHYGFVYILISVQLELNLKT